MVFSKVDGAVFVAIAAISLSVPTVVLPLVAVNAAGRERFPIIYGFMLTGSFAGTGIGVPDRASHVPGLAEALQNHKADVRK